jgi:malate permease and related proteins
MNKQVINNMSSIVIVDQVIILFLMMGTGFYARKRKMITDEGRKTLSDILVNITSPLLVISAFKLNFSADMVKNAMFIIAFSFTSMIILILLGKILYLRYKGDTNAVLRFATVFPNWGFMGLPVVQALYGKTGIFYGSLFQFAFQTFIWTYGVALISGKKDFKSMKSAFLNPGIVSVFVGFTIFLFSINIPGTIYRAIDMLGSITVPLSMIIIGSNMADVKFRDGFLKSEIYYVSFVRLLLIPFVSIIALKLMGISGPLLGTCVAMQAMPVATFAAIFSEKYDGDKYFASQCVFITTLISLVTIPLVIMFL